MAKIRQEINILTTTVNSNNTDRHIVLLDTTQYNGTVTYYFEVLAFASVTTTDVFLTRKGTSTDDATITVVGGAAKALYRTSFTPPAGSTEYMFHAEALTAQTYSARIIIIQEADTLTNTETQIEIGNYNTARTAESATILTNPKYWKYDASKWDGTTTFYAEAVYDSGDMDTISVYLYTTSDILAPSWSSVATIVSAATTTTPTRTRVAFTPVDGQWYTIFSLNGSMDNHDIYRAGIVVQQQEGGHLPSVAGQDADIFGGTAGAGQTDQAAAQLFQITAASSITGVKLKLFKTGSPTDTISVDLVSSLGGASLANGTLSSSSLTTSPAVYEITFGTPYSASASTNYYIQVTRSPDTRDATNYISWSRSNGGTFPYDSSVRSNNSWSTVGNENYFELVGITGITKLEPQYLLANTLFAAGTALQTFLTKWDSTEWDGVTNAYYFQAEAANGSTSDVTLEQADGGGTVTDSTLTNIDNAQISAAMTMPTSENLDTKATTNAGDVAAARILVGVSVDEAGGGGPAGPGHEYIIITSGKNHE